LVLFAIGLPWIEQAGRRSEEQVEAMLARLLERQ
jgi:hypothetical protein